MLYSLHTALSIYKKLRKETLFLSLWQTILSFGLKWEIPGRVTKKYYA